MIIAIDVLPSPGGPEHQDVIRRAAAKFCTGEHQLQLLTNTRLPDEVVETLGTQTRFDVAVPCHQFGGDLRLVVEIVDRVEVHRVLPSNDRAERSATDVVASGDSARTESVACSACLIGKPRPSRASTI